MLRSPSRTPRGSKSRRRRPIRAAITACRTWRLAITSFRSRRMGSAPAQRKSPSPWRCGHRGREPDGRCHAERSAIARRSWLLAEPDARQRCGSGPARQALAHAEDSPAARLDRHDSPGRHGGHLFWSGRPEHEQRLALGAFGLGFGDGRPLFHQRLLRDFRAEDSRDTRRRARSACTRCWPGFMGRA